MTAICHRRGSQKRGPLVPCKACRFTPTGIERPTAWLFSTHHLSAEELSYAQQRVQQGDRPDPARALQQDALTAMGARALPVEARAPMAHRSLLGITLGNLIFSSLVGYAVWFRLRGERPLAAAQVLRITIPVTAATTVLWVMVVLSGHVR